MFLGAESDNTPSSTASSPLRLRAARVLRHLEFTQRMRLSGRVCALHATTSGLEPATFRLTAGSQVLRPKGTSSYRMNRISSLQGFRLVPDAYQWLP